MVNTHHTITTYSHPHRYHITNILPYSTVLLFFGFGSVEAEAADDAAPLIGGCGRGRRGKLGNGRVLCVVLSLLCVTHTHIHVTK